MKSDPQASSQEVLAGLVERVTYHNAENGFCVLRAKARGHRDVVTVVGHAATIAAGEWITASGEWINDRTYGQQFKARFLRTSPPTSAENRNAGHEQAATPHPRIAPSRLVFLCSPLAHLPVASERSAGIENSCLYVV